MRSSSLPTSGTSTLSTSPTNARSTHSSIRILDEHGRLDIAANVAGTVGHFTPNVADATTRPGGDTLQVNLDAVFFCLRAELRAMRAAGNGGSIVNVASSAGKMGVPGLSAYSASKHGVIGLTKSAALEVARDGIRVNAVCPGTIRTPMLRGFVGGDEETLEKMGRRAPIGRIGEPEEIAEAIVWLCTDAASFVTGHALEADGGVAAILTCSPEVTVGNAAITSAKRSIGVVSPRSDNDTIAFCTPASASSR